MKTSILKTIKTGILVIGVLALVSCQGPSSTPLSAVSCDKCHTVYFKAPNTGFPGSKGVVSLKTVGTMSCPDCENKVVAMFKGGNITRHACSSCGGTLHHCTSH